MRIRTRELRAKRKRKEETIKLAIKEAKATSAAGGKKPAKAAKPAAAPKKAAKKAAEAPASE